MICNHHLRWGQLLARRSLEVCGLLSCDRKNLLPSPVPKSEGPGAPGVGPGAPDADGIQSGMPTNRPRPVGNTEERFVSITLRTWIEITHV
jgi:hypothetical protein